MGAQLFNGWLKKAACNKKEPREANPQVLMKFELRNRKFSDKSSGSQLRPESRSKNPVCWGEIRRPVARN